MNLIEQLNKETSRKNTDKIESAIGSDKKKFHELMQLVFLSDDRQAWKAAWVAETIIFKYPELCKPYLDQITNLLSQTKHSGFKRALLKIIQKSFDNFKSSGIIINTCFNFILSDKESIAVKCSAMEIIANFCSVYPDLITEFNSCLSENGKRNSTTFQNKRNKLLRQLKKV